MTDILQQLRLVVRRLVSERRFTILALLTLALPLAANSAIFSVLHAVLLRPLAFGDPGRLVQVTVGSGGTELSLPNMADIGALPAVEGIGAYVRAGRFLMEGEPELIHGCNLDASLLSLLKVRPLAGRLFTKSEDVENGPKEIVISERFWRRRFGSDPAVIGRALPFGSSGATWRVIGVMPSSFRFPPSARDVDFYAPLMQDISRRARTDRDFVYLDVVARLRPGVSLADANRQLAALSARLASTYPASNAGISFHFVTLNDAVVARVRPVLILLMSAVGAVLLIGCANVANLLMARSTGRKKELAIRAALGATRGWIVQHLLLESCVLSLAAGTIGVALAVLITKALVILAPPETPRLDGVHVDGPVLLFALALSLITGIASGLAPALRSGRGNLNDPLKSGSRVSRDRRGSRARSVFVGAAIALSLILLASAGLLIRSFAALLSVDPGFDSAGVVAMRLVPSTAAYGTPEKVAAFYSRVLREVRGIPGVEAAGGIDTLPLSGGENVFGFNIAGHAPLPPGAPEVRLGNVLPGYFETMKIPLLRGRTFDERDSSSSTKVMVVSSSFVRKYLSGEEPIGKTVSIPTMGSMQIVGVVGDVKLVDLAEDIQPMFYRAGMQWDTRVYSVIARRPRAGGLGEAMRAALKRIDPRQPVVSLETVDSFRSDTLATRRFALLLLGALASIAVLLASIGIYSVMSYVVAQSTAEIGVRMALGAGASDVFRLVVGRALRLVAVAGTIGAVGAFATTRMLRSILFRVTPGDPLTFVATCAVIAVAALLASWLPARRAARVDPAVAIRTA